jgi:hypothetical protein
MAAALLVATPVAGQETEQAPDSWRGYVTIGLDASGGNTQLTIFRGGFGLTFLRTDQAEFDISASARYGENQNAVIEREFRASVKFDFQPQADWTPFIYSNFFRDPIRRRLDVRLATGGGGKYTYGRWTGGKASLSLAGVWTLDQFTTVDDQPSEKDRNEARFSWRSKVDHAFPGGRASFQQISFYQPVWNEWGDYIFIAQTSLRAQIVGSLSMQVAHEFIHDETPVSGVGQDDWKLNVSFRYDW